jgi:Cu/Zn superoxide dismutase
VRKSAVVLALGVFALALVGGATARSEANKIQVEATLNAAQERPRPGGNVRNARGTFTGTITRRGSGGNLVWRLNTRGLTGAAAAAHIHVAPRGRPGPVAVPLCGPCSNTARGRASVDAALVRALTAGRAYVNVHTARNAAGEIRGQLGIAARVRTALNAGQEVPEPTGDVSGARGLFTASVTKSGRTATMTWRLTFSGLTGAAAAAHVHIGARGQAGAVAIPLCGPCRNGVTGRATVGGATLEALQAGRAYVNVHTAQNAPGEIRGQIAAVPLSLSASSGGGSGGGGGGGGGGDDPPPPPPPYP